MTAQMPRGDLLDPDVRTLWHAVANRLEHGADPGSIKTLRVGLAPAGRAVVAGWLGKAHRGGLRADAEGYVKVPVAKVLDALGMTPTQLYVFVDDLIGISEDAQSRRQTDQARQQLWNYAADTLPDNPLLIAQLRAAGVSKDTVGTTTALIEALARVRSLLPLPRPVHLARIGLTCAGDPHYFDLNDAGYGGRLVQMAAEILGRPAPDNPLAERTYLADIGIHADRLSQTVMALNIDATGDGPTDRAIRTAKADGRLIHLNLSDLTDHPPQFVTAQRWLVVENPSIPDEALSRRHTGPIVCTRGAFTAVEHALLALAQAQGVPMAYSGDLDRGGRSAASAADAYGAEIHLMDERTAQIAADAGPLTRLPAQVPVLPGPSQVPASSSPSVQTCTIFQEHPALLDLLLGRDPDDPLDAARLTPPPQPVQADGWVPSPGERAWHAQGAVDASSMRTATACEPPRFAVPC